MFFSACSQSNTTNDWANLAKYAVENKKIPAPSASEKRVVFMGNSITEFWKTTDSSFFAGKSYIDRGISAQVTEQMLLRFQQDVIALQPSVVVILAGINDIAENNGPISLENIFNNIVSMVTMSKEHHIHVVLCSVLPAFQFPWRKELLPAAKVIRLNQMIRDYAKEHNIVYVDYHSALKDDSNGLDKKFTNDGVHPVLAGYKVMEPLVEAGILKAL